MIFKKKDTKALYYKEVKSAFHCDFCEEHRVDVIQFEDENETRLCAKCVEQIKKINLSISTK